MKKFFSRVLKFLGACMILFMLSCLVWCATVIWNAFHFDYTYIPTLNYSDGQKTISQEFGWNYDGNYYRWTLEIPETLIEYDREMIKLCDEFRSSNENDRQAILASADDNNKKLLSSAFSENYEITPWVADPLNYEYIGKLAERLAVQAEKDQYDYFHTAEFVLKFAQSTPFEVRELQLPAYTLFNDGDCDCLSVLYASILKKMGYDIAFLQYSSEKVNHMAIGIAFTDQQLPAKWKTFYEMKYYIHDGIKYYYAEISSDNLIGELTFSENEAELMSQEPKIIPIRIEE
ncbi:MAG TPA: hypothetical protein PKN87_10065 [Syntrophomonadaceae bacterium]|nr:hypothetical protein [Syntrophomonadaceae bacterium]HPR94207.1 hypothetical protein [Syntrophomonadaceae bacterium]